MIIGMSEIVHAPNLQFDIDEIGWDNVSCPRFSKHDLDSSDVRSRVLLPLSATLMCTGFFWCCFLWKPQKPYGLCCGALLRYPFAITLCVYCWRLYDRYCYFHEKHCILDFEFYDIRDSTSSMDSDLDSDSYSLSFSSTSSPSLLNADTTRFRVDDISSFYYRLCIYYTLILALMLPSLVALYYMMRCIAYCIHSAKAPLHNVAGRAMASTRMDRSTTTQSTYSDKEQRFNLVERSVAECPICIQPELELIVTKGCRHGCCAECLRQYIETDLKNIASYPMKCFMNDCNTLLNYTNVEYVLQHHPHHLVEYDRMLIKSSTSGSNETITCPLCNAVMLKPRNGEDQGLMHCVNEQCRADLCSRCGVLYHLNKSCEEYAAEMRAKTSGADEEFAKLTRLKKWCKCPNCGLVIERTEGCYHMTHHGCPGGGVERTTDFCYFCGELLMKKNGEGWRYSKVTQQKHFEQGVYAKCVHAEDGRENELSARNRNDSLEWNHNHDLDIMHNANVRLDLDGGLNADIDVDAHHIARHEMEDTNPFADDQLEISL